LTSTFNGGRQGRWQKNLQGGGQRKERLKNSKKDRKLALLSFFQGGANGKKGQKVAKKDQKIALLSLFITYRSLPSLGWSRTR